jgi:hypothetical protein
MQNMLLGPEAKVFNALSMLATFLRRYISFAVLVSVFAPMQVFAQFLQTMSSGVYQSADGHVKVIVGNNEGAQGIFVAYVKEEITPQEFNAEKLPAKTSSHAFISFDATEENGYHRLTIGEKSFKIVGNLTLNLTDGGGVAVNIDNTAPYLTITQRGQGKSAETLVGFYGTTPVVQGSGALATILTANQLSPEISKVMKPYELKSEGLFLNGKEVDSPNIGLFIKREHECLKPNTSLLTLAQLKQIQASKGEVAQAKLLEQYLRDNQKRSPTQGFLVLRADANAPVVMLNITEKNVFDLRGIKNSFSAKKICVLSPIS